MFTFHFATLGNFPEILIIKLPGEGFPPFFFLFWNLIPGGKLRWKNVSVMGVTKTTEYPRASGNFSTPAQNFRFIPGSTPSYGNLTESTLSSPVFNGTGYYIDDEVEPGDGIFLNA